MATIRRPGLLPHGLDGVHTGHHREVKRHTAKVHGLDGVHTGLHRESKLHHAAGVLAKASPQVEVEADRGGASDPRGGTPASRDGPVDPLPIVATELAPAVDAAEPDDDPRVALFEDRRRKRSRGGGADADTTGDEPHGGSGGFEGAAAYFEDAMGDPTLVDPNEMKRRLGPTVRFAQHAMLLAEARLAEGMPRDEALAFLASLYLGVRDRAYAQKALQQFGAGTGLIDLYPLELMGHLLDHVPSFLARVSRGRFLVDAPSSALEGEVGRPLVLRYDPALKLRGFALAGGAKPGYLLEPVDPPGTHQLTFASAGRFTVLLSAMGPPGLVIEELTVEVRPATTPAAAHEARAPDHAPRAPHAPDRAPHAPAADRPPPRPRRV